MNQDSSDTPLVTVVCITYNHALYIRQAIDSFLKQKTNFAFDILIHDDASTDGTDRIIQEYAEKYPDKIKTILQSDNQYVKDPHIWEHICFPRVKSKYIAICEGDDMWNSADKLQIQIEKMETAADITMTCCNSYTITADGERLSVVNPYADEGFITPADIINSNRAMLSTCTVVFRNDVLNYRKDFYDKTITGDFPLEVLCATNGRVYYFKEPMASYRTMIQGSWSQTLKSDKNNVKQHMLCLTTSRFLLDVKYSDGNRFAGAIDGKICRYLYNYIVTNGDTSIDEYKCILQSLPAKKRIMLRMTARFPGMAEKMKNIIKRRKQIK